MATKTKQPAVLDPSKEVKSFSASHASLVDVPGNGKEFLLVQGDYSEKVEKALSTLSGLIGPCVDYMREDAYRAISALYNYLDRQDASKGVPMMYTFSEDGKITYHNPSGEAFEYKYPAVEDAAEILLNLDGVAEGVEIAPEVQVLRTLVGAYTPEAWVLSDDAVFMRGGTLRQLATDKVLRAAMNGEDTVGLATMVKNLDNDKGVLVLKGTPLWDLMQESEPHLEGEQTLFAENSGEEDVSPMKDFSTDPATSVSTAGTATSPAPTVPPEQRAREHVRALMAQQDPTLSPAKVEPPVQSESGTRQDAGPAAISAALAAVLGPGTVNPATAQGDVSANPEDKFESLRSALSVEGLTDEQRLGIVRHFMGGSDPQDETITPKSISEAILEAVAPLAEKLSLLERSLSETDVPLRRSLRTAPSKASGGREYDPYRPFKVEELARRNIPY